MQKSIKDLYKSNVIAVPLIYIKFLIHVSICALYIIVISDYTIIIIYVFFYITEGDSESPLIGAPLR